MAGHISVSGVWLRRVGDDIQVLVETNGRWKLVITELMDGQISHIVEPAGIKNAPDIDHPVLK